LKWKFFPKKGLSTIFPSPQTRRKVSTVFLLLFIYLIIKTLLLEAFNLQPYRLVLKNDEPAPSWVRWGTSQTFKTDALTWKVKGKASLLAMAIGKK